MTDFKSDIDGISVTNNTEGGVQPALGNNSRRGTDDEEGVSPGIAKVVDIASFRALVETIANQHPLGSMAGNEARSLVSSVAAVRNLESKIDPEQIQMVIEDAFPATAPSASEDGVRSNTISDGGRPHGIITADQLQQASFAPPVMVIPPFIAEGVTLLAGKPKLGKSWLVLDTARAIASGMHAFGTVSVAQGQVLGLFLEDSERRLQARLRKLDTSAVWPSDFHLTTQWARLDDGGLADLDSWRRQVPNPKLIAIDTLAKIRPSTGSRKSQYDLDYEALTGLHEIAHAHQVAIVVVHHTRKADADDVFDTVSGTLGLTGSADSILILSKKSGKVVLNARGRDIEDSETALSFDGGTGRWIALGAVSEVLVSDERLRIVTALEHSPEPMSPKEIMLATNNSNRNAIDLLLLKMVKDGLISKVARGKYVSTGKIGKKDLVGEQVTDRTAEKETLADLSDLSAEREHGRFENL
jgi:hypothetical protein